MNRAVQLQGVLLMYVPRTTRHAFRRSTSLLQVCSSNLYWVSRQNASAAWQLVNATCTKAEIQAQAQAQCVCMGCQRIWCIYHCPVGVYQFVSVMA